MNLNPPLIGGLAILLAAVIFVPAIRRFVRFVLRVAIVVFPLAAATAGIAMIMNNETIFEEPGASRRIVRFLTMNSAAASKSGSGSIGCDLSAPPAEQPAAAPAEARKRRHRGTPREAPPPAATAGAAAAPDDTYPELVLRGYPGLPRRKLFDLSRETADSLGGWRIAATNPAAYTLDCVHTSRIFKLEDDIRITVRPNGEIGVCSRSGAIRPGSTSLLRFVPGDLGANVGHIKEFYEALEPRTDAAYKEEQERQNAKRPS